MPRVDRDRATRHERSAYPGSLRDRTAGCMRVQLSDQVGLTQFGVGEVELAPGSATSLTHWHEGEDELVYVLEGEVTLVEQRGDRSTDRTEQVLRAGDAAGFRAGDPVGHSFENRTERPVRLLEIGSRHARETAHYVGIDMVYRREDGSRSFESRDGVPYAPEDEPRRLDG